MFTMIERLGPIVRDLYLRFRQVAGRISRMTGLPTPAVHPPCVVSVAYFGLLAIRADMYHSHVMWQDYVVRLK